NEPNGGLGKSTKRSGREIASETNPTGVWAVRERNETMKPRAKRTQWGSGQTGSRDSPRRAPRAPGGRPRDSRGWQEGRVPERTRAVLRAVSTPSVRRPVHRGKTLERTQPPSPARGRLAKRTQR